MLQALAEHELNYGESSHAEEVYRGLILRSPEWNGFTRTYHINRGTALVLLTRYDDAADTYKEVLEADPNDAEATLNLADVELARKHPEDAKALYDRVLSLLSREDPGRQASADQRMIKAQCLAHLGSTREAMDIAKETVDRNPTNVTLLSTAAMVFALAGDRQALVYIKDAIDRGHPAKVVQTAVLLPVFRRSGVPGDRGAPEKSLNAESKTADQMAGRSLGAARPAVSTPLGRGVGMRGTTDAATRRVRADDDDQAGLLQDRKLQGSGQARR